MQGISMEINHIYEGLGKFFRYNRNEMVRLEMRMDKVERNVNLLTWQNSIEYLDFNGEEYTEMDDVKKIVCLVRDFYDITKGEYSTANLLLLKAAMSVIGINPKSQVNYGQVLESVAEDDALKNKLFGGKYIRPISDPGYLVAMSGLQKMDALKNEEKYTVDTVADYVSKYDDTVTAEMIRRDLTSNYLKNAAGVDVDTELDSFDMVLDLLYSLKQAEEEHLLVFPEEDSLQEKEKETMEKDPKLQSAEEMFFDYKLEEAHAVFTELAEAGNGCAMYFLGEYCNHGYAPEHEDKVKAIDWWEKGTESGDALAAVRYAESLPHSSGKRKQLLNDFAGKVLSQAEAGDPIAQNEAAQMYREGCGVEAGTAKMKEWLAKSGDAGFWLSQTQLGKCFSDEKDYEEAAAWYKQAALSGYAAAQDYLGECYYYGNGVEKDKETAVKWFQKAAEQGYAAAQNHLGYCYYRGEGVGRDQETAVKWFQKAAEQGYAAAQNNLGVYYCTPPIRIFGMIPCRSEESNEGVKWFRKAAEQGYAAAQNNLGICYDWGQGIGKNYTEALKWFRKAAEQGYAAAQNNLGIFYRRGKVVTKNEEEARKWMQKAEEQENKAGQEHLGEVLFGYRISVYG